VRFPFNERKAAQAAAYLLKRHKGKINYMVLIKLLYLADRRALILRGLPVTGDRIVSMSKGPVLSGILDLINWGSANERSDWLEYVSTPEGYDVCLRKPDPETDELSRYELALLDEIDERFGSWDKWTLVKYTHRLPEWRDPNGSSFPIDPSEILRAENRPEEDISRISEDADELRFLQFLDQLKA
jgi:uncharacterized phage-associated protein